MNGLLLVIQTISDFLWGTPMTIALIGTGLYLSIKFKFRYITKIKFHFQNTFGKMFKGKGEGEGTVSGFAAACTAMANTIGVGNIGGVATAITMGGPGAIFWMWISALLGMSTKACEIILGQRYRVKYENSMDMLCSDRISREFLKRSIWDQTIICDHCIRNHLLLNDRRWIKENFFCYGTNRAIYGNVIYPWWNRNSFDEYQCSTRSRCTDL